MKIVALSSVFYVAGLLSQSWFGLLLPVKDALPGLWVNLKRVERLIGTARDGLFFAFLFISLGMLTAFSGIRLKRKNALVLTIVFMAGWYGEIRLVHYLGFSRANDMYILMVPAVLFLFLFLKEILLPDHIIYRKLRTVSGLTYFTHELVGFTVTPVLKQALIMLPWIRFITVLAGSLLVSQVIMIMSGKPKLKKLAFLYR